ncbi:hypothetical protein [Vibrio sp.]|uniref:hypothetical protein n=1 Tax=Vibrio sp. TaxID=678 RepID=UPI003AA9B839
MTNQQLKAHCEDVIANPQDHPDWVVDMARVALASLEAEPFGYCNEDSIGNDVYSATVWIDKEDAEKNSFGLGLFEVFTAPPAPELKQIELPNCVDDLHGVGPVMSAEDVERAIRAAGCEVK